MNHDFIYICPFPSPSLLPSEGSLSSFSLSGAGWYSLSAALEWSSSEVCSLFRERLQEGNRVFVTKNASIPPSFSFPAISGRLLSGFELYDAPQWVPVMLCPDALQAFLSKQVPRMPVLVETLPSVRKGRPRGFDKIADIEG